MNKICTNLIVVIVILSSGLIYSQDSITVVPKISEGDIDINYLKGVESDNLGLKISSTYYLGERQSTKAVIPLLKVLKQDPSIEARITAALALFKIGDERGIFAIKRASEFDNNEQIRKMCAIFYQMYLSTKGNKEGK